MKNKSIHMDNHILYRQSYVIWATVFHIEHQHHLSALMGHHFNFAVDAHHSFCRCGSKKKGKFIVMAYDGFGRVVLEVIGYYRTACMEKVRLFLHYSAITLNRKKCVKHIWV